MTLKYLCVIEIESNLGHYNDGIIDLEKQSVVLNVSDMDGRLLKNVAAVS